MQRISKIFNFKISLLILAIVTIICIFTLNRMVVNELRSEARNQVEFLAKSYSEAINSSNQEDMRYVIDILLPSMNFPIIITSKDEISTSMNLDINSKYNKDEYQKKLWVMVNEMDKTFKPIDLIWDDLKWGQIHYSDPIIISKIRIIPYLEISFSILFIAIMIWGIQIIRKSEKNLIYVGMARETAHQLGTPISSIMGWVKLLRDKYVQDSIINHIEEDIVRLSEVSERFSKIGSTPKLKKISLNNLISVVCSYMKVRLPRKSEIEIRFLENNNFYIKGESVLLRWAIENLIKNSIDAIGQGKGVISVKIYSNNNNNNIDIKDTGKGIKRVDWKNIFKPGFSSKNRGWGLGLSLTQRIIEEIHSGTIVVLSSKQSETIFRISIPKR